MGRKQEGWWLVRTNGLCGGRQLRKRG